MDSHFKNISYKKEYPRSGKYPRSDAPASECFRERESYFSLCVRDFGEGKNEILIGEYEIGKGESQILIGEFEIGKGESQVLIGEFEIGIGESQALIGEFEIGKGESRALIGEFEILQLRMLIICLFLRFLSFRTNFEVKNSFILKNIH